MSVESHAEKETVGAAKPGKVQQSRLRSLDILRGIAILLVFVNHFEPRVIPYTANLTGGLATFVYWRVKSLGWTGVDMFFVLSGFLISGLLFREMDKTNGLKCWRFWLRRGFKIWPSYAFLLVVLGVGNVTEYIDYSSAKSIVLSILTHVLFLQNYLASNPNGPTWSLAVEEHFYILLPLLFLGILALSAKTGKSWRAYLPYVAGVFIVGCLVFRVLQAFFGIAPNDFMQTHLRLDALMYGVYINYLCLTKSPLIEFVHRHRIGSLIVSLTCLVPAAFFGRAHPFMFTVGFSLLSIGYGILLVLMYGGMFSAFEKRPTAVAISSIGTWSYNIYLWHYFIVAFPAYSVVNDVLMMYLGSPVTVAVGQALAFVLGSIVVGYIVTKAVEDPLLRLRNRVVPSDFGIAPRPASEPSPAE